MAASDEHFRIPDGYDFGAKPEANINLPPAAYELLTARSEKVGEALKRITGAVEDLAATTDDEGEKDLLRFSILYLVQQFSEQEMNHRRRRAHRSN